LKELEGQPHEKDVKQRPTKVNLNFDGCFPENFLYDKNRHTIEMT